MNCAKLEEFSDYLDRLKDLAEQLEDLEKEMREEISGPARIPIMGECD